MRTEGDGSVHFQLVINELYKISIGTRFDLDAGVRKWRLFAIAGTLAASSGLGSDVSGFKVEGAI